MVLELSTASMQARRRELLLTGILTTLGGLLFGCLLAVRLARGVIGPIVEVGKVVERIGKGELSARVAVDGNSSLRRLEQGVNQMAARIESGQEELQRRIAEATAELRIKKEEAELAAQALSEANSELVTIMEANPDILYVIDRKGRLTKWNSSFESFCGLTHAEMMHKPATEFVWEEDRGAVTKGIADVFEKGAASIEVRIVRHDGAPVPYLCNGVVLMDAHGEVTGFTGTGRDIAKKRESDELIWQQANFDALTGLPNRRMFHDRLDQELKKAHRAGLPLALMFLDLDRFKDVNDTLGHDVGDILLKDTARRLSGCVRESDTVARLGGDEFTVVLGELEDPGSVERVAQEILKHLAEPFQLGNETAYISASIGITLYPEDGTAVDELLKNADQAMYAAKSQGRNRCSYFTPSMQEAAQTRMRLARDLRGALAGNQFCLHYQPILALTTGVIHKAEALIRWQHPVRGLVGPAEFIAIAEDTGLIADIGNWVFREAARQTRRWRAQQPEFQVSVNMSPVQFHNNDGSQAAWFEHLQHIGLPGQAIVVEITEGLLLDARPEVKDKLLAFRDKGIQVSLDDFGTGYSSLSYLKKFDIDYLKIDQSFVRNLAPASDDLALCEAIIVMAHKLGLQVIAEGIESAAQRALLAAAGCDYGQGYLFSRPVPAAEFGKLLGGGSVRV
ncbi:cyclic di-GMP phosphodiesterase Gmr [mine drainage metagenome]|uniref:Cyclic di-GMP phosphodiesterase Gmr n=1 Tax=mine drainage metagenome TaxID=410659 RepID=A0A1J5R267_9ZZZZ